MGVLKRFGNIMSCKVNSLLSKSKNPLKDVDKYIALLESQLGEIKAEKEAVDVLEKRKKREVLECEDTVDKFQRYVDKSLASNKERDAKRFMEQKSDAEKKLEVLKKEYALIADSNKKMLQMDEKLINDINELKAKKEEIKNKLMQAKSGASVNTKLDEASKNADKALFKAEALAELNDGSYKNSDISDMSIFDELYEEKAKKLKKVQDEYDKFNRNILRKTDDEPKQEAAAPSVKAAASMSDIPAAPLLR